MYGVVRFFCVQHWNGSEGLSSLSRLCKIWASWERSCSEAKADLRSQSPRGEATGWRGIWASTVLTLLETGQLVFFLWAKRGSGAGTAFNTWSLFSCCSSGLGPYKISSVQTSALQRCFSIELRWQRFCMAQQGTRHDALLCSCFFWHFVLKSWDNTRVPVLFQKTAEAGGALPARVRIAGY